MSDQALEQSPDLSIEDRMAALVAEDIPEDEPEAQEQEAAPQDNEEEATEAEDTDTPDENEEQVEAEEEEAEPDLVEVEVDGQSYKVPEALKDKIMLQADYTRKTQEVAEQRKQVEQNWQQLQQQAALQQQNLGEYAKLTALDDQLQQYQQLDWNSLYDRDPAEFVRLKEARRDLIDQRDGLASQIMTKQQEQMVQQQQLHQQTVEEGNKALASKIPNWNRDYGLSLVDMAVEKYGFSKDELLNVTNPSVFLALNDLLKFHKQKSNQPLVDKRVANLPKVSKPGGPAQKTLSQQKESDARKQLKKTGSVDDAAALFLARMNK
jgi:hypothetical protein